DLGIGHVLVVMPVDIDDEKILVAALDRLVIGMLQQRLRIHLGDGRRRQVAHAETIHSLRPPPYCAAPRSARRLIFASDRTGSRLKVRLALPPRMLRFAVSERNGRS